MNRSLNIASCAIVLVFVAFAAVACNKAGSATDTPSANTAAANMASAPASNTATASSTKDISGTYTVTGQNEGGGGNYSGDLTVAKRGEVYQFSWNSGGKLSDGVGVQAGGSVGVAFTAGDDGTGCGVVLYQIEPNGTLNGKAGYWGVDQAESETATRTSGSDLEGSYDIKGSSPDGKSYNGKLDVKKQGAGYDFTWNTGNTLKGFGIRGANMVAVGIGGSKCGFVGYDIQGDGSLQGKWGSAGSTDVGTETAKKK